MEVDVEAVFDSEEDVVLIDVMVASVDYAFCSRPAFLRGSDCSPEYSFASSASITS